MRARGRARVRRERVPQTYRDALDCALDWAAMGSIEEIRVSDGAARGKRRAVESP